jgi:hypothetical protein
MIDGARERLLGRHVRQCADLEIAAAHPLGRQSGALAVRQDALRQPEVQHLHGTRRRDHDVRALQIAVHDVALARVLERARNLQRDFDDPAARQLRS